MFRNQVQRCESVGILEAKSLVWFYVVNAVHTWSDSLRGSAEDVDPAIL